jgi:hypothetical protein
MNGTLFVKSEKVEDEKCEREKKEEKGQRKERERESRREDIKIICMPWRSRKAPHEIQWKEKQEMRKKPEHLTNP